MPGTMLKGLKITKVDFVDQGANPDADIALFKSKEPPKPPGKLASFFRAIAKKFTLTDDEADEAAAELIEKAAETFNEKLQEEVERRKATELWNLWSALYESVDSILSDDNVTDKRAMAQASLAQFCEKAGAAIAAWQPAEITGVEDITKQEDDTDDPDEDRDDEQDEEDTEMKIDKSKLTPEEIAQLDAIMKKAGDPVGDPEDGEGSADKTVEKAAGAALPPEVQAELEAMRKRFSDLEDRELEGVAKKYEILGKKPEDLVPVLKRLKVTDPEAYGQYIAVLDEGVAMIGKSGAFEETGRNGHGVNQPWEAIQKRAGELCAADPKMSFYDAVVQVGRENPALVQQYEQSRQ